MLKCVYFGLCCYVFIGVIGFGAIGYNYDRLHNHAIMCDDTRTSVACCDVKRSRFDFPWNNNTWCHPTHRYSIFVDTMNCTFRYYESSSSSNLTEPFTILDVLDDFCWNEKTQTWSTFIKTSAMSALAFNVLLIVFYGFWICLTCIYFQEIFVRLRAEAAMTTR
jgi:hypothetical protein